MIWVVFAYIGDDPIKGKPIEVNLTNMYYKYPKGDDGPAYFLTFLVWFMFFAVH